MSEPGRRVVHIITRLVVGGAQENTVLSCIGLRDRGYDVTLVTGPEAGPEGSLLDAAKGAGLRVEIFKWLRRNPKPLLDPVALIALWRFLRRERPDIVHTHSSKAGILGRAAAWMAGVPVVVHTNHGLPFHSSQPWIVNRFWKFLERRVAGATSLFVCVGETMKRQSVEAGLAPPERHVVVYSGMDLDFVDRPPAAGPPVIGWVGRLVAQKGARDLPEILDAVLARVPDASLEIVGDGPLRAELEGALASRPARFIGRVAPSDVPRRLAGMDVVALTSYWEGLPRVAAQAAMAGLPVAAYDVEGASEVVRSGETGFLVPMGDKRALADRIVEILSKPDRGRAMGTQGREFVGDRFEGRRMVDELDRIYRTLK
jgi:glycosyltransferase involved in cell wall biosynthesis